MFQHSFLQKLISVVLAGLVAAGVLYLYRHIVQRAFYESNEGWREVFKPTPAHRGR